MMNRRMILQAIIGTLVLMIILSLSLVGSPWPWAVLSHQSLAIRILGWFLVFQIGAGTMAYLVWVAISSKDCAINECGKNIEQYASVYGPPTFCEKCRAICHKNCLRSNGGRCSKCRPEKTDASVAIPFDFTRDSH